MKELHADYIQKQ